MDFANDMSFDNGGFPAPEYWNDSNNPTNPQDLLGNFNDFTSPAPADPADPELPSPSMQDHIASDSSRVEAENSRGPYNNSGDVNEAVYVNNTDHGQAYYGVGDNSNPQQSAFALEHDYAQNRPEAFDTQVNFQLDPSLLEIDPREFLEPGHRVWRNPYTNGIEIVSDELLASLGLVADTSTQDQTAAQPGSEIVEEIENAQWQQNSATFARSAGDPRSQSTLPQTPQVPSQPTNSPTADGPVYAGHSHVNTFHHQESKRTPPSAQAKLQGQPRFQSRYEQFLAEHASPRPGRQRDRQTLPSAPVARRSNFEGAGIPFGDQPNAQAIFYFQQRDDRNFRPVSQQQWAQQQARYGQDQQADATGHPFNQDGSLTSPNPPFQNATANDYHEKHTSSDFESPAQQLRSPNRPIEGQQRSINGNSMLQRGRASRINASSGPQQGSSHSSSAQLGDESSHGMVSPGSSMSSVSISPSPALQSATKRRAYISATQSNKKAKTGDDAKALTESERALVNFAILAALSDEERPIYSKHTFASLEEAKAHLARDSDDILYHSLRIEQDDDGVLSDEQLKIFSQNLFDVITDWPGPLTEVHTTKIKGQKLEWLNEKHTDRYDLIVKSMLHSVTRKDASANIEVLVEHVKTLHSKGIPMADLDVSKFSEEDVTDDTIDASKVNMRLCHYKVDHSSTFLTRLGCILDIVKMNKWVAYDVIEGNNLLALAACPVPYHEKKFANNALNGKRNEATTEGRKILRARKESEAKEKEKEKAEESEAKGDSEQSEESP